MNKDRINTIFDTSKEVLEYLKNNPDSWKTEEGEIRFNSQEKYDQYAKILDKIKNA